LLLPQLINEQVRQFGFWAKEAVAFQGIIALFDPFPKHSICKVSEEAGAAITHATFCVSGR